MAEYIERESVKNILKRHEHRFTCADESNGYGTVKWSEYVIYSDTAQNCIDALPAADVRPVVLCRDCKHRDPEDHKCDCGQLERAGCIFLVDDNYFCAYGEM